MPSRPQRAPFPIALLVFKDRPLSPPLLNPLLNLPELHQPPRRVLPPSLSELYQGKAQIG